MVSWLLLGFSDGSSCFQGVYAVFRPGSASGVVEYMRRYIVCHVGGGGCHMNVGATVVSATTVSGVSDDKRLEQQYFGCRVSLADV